MQSLRSTFILKKSGLYGILQNLIFFQRRLSATFYEIVNNAHIEKEAGESERFRLPQYAT